MDSHSTKDGISVLLLDGHSLTVVHARASSPVVASRGGAMGKSIHKTAHTRLYFVPSGRTSAHVYIHTCIVSVPFWSGVTGCRCAMYRVRDMKCCCKPIEVTPTAATAKAGDWSLRFCRTLLPTRPKLGSPHSKCYCCVLSTSFLLAVLCVDSFVLPRLFFPFRPLSSFCFLPFLLRGQSNASGGGCRQWLPAI